MRVHFIAIGGSAMHNLAIELSSRQDYYVTGSDDEIFEPSMTRLREKGLLPEKTGWFPEKITKNLDAVVLGMHAKADNPELVKALELGLKIYSYPEYLYEQSKNKKRIVIGGSHGKTTITSIVMHVFKNAGLKFSFMAGAKVRGFTNMVSISEDSEYMIIEGDEYLSSPIDTRPKFHLYKPDIALISGIAWDHVNVFPTFSNYVEQFSIFTDVIQQNGALIWYKNDDNVKAVAGNIRHDIKSIPYEEFPFSVENGKTYILWNNKKIPLLIFGKHNIQNISGAYEICRLVGIPDETFFTAVSSFEGADKRLQLLGANDTTSVFLDFAHSPSKVKATIEAVRELFPYRKIVSCLELHTYSSLKKEFLNEYRNTMDSSAEALIYYNNHTVELKRLEKISPENIVESFGRNDLKVFTLSMQLIDYLLSSDYRNTVLLLMSSGNFDGINFKDLTARVLSE